MFKNILKSLIIPLLFLVLGLHLIKSHGPQYQGWLQDPDYPYLLNSLRAAVFRTPHHIDHPGTPLQMIGAVVSRTKYFFSYSLKDHTFVDSVLLHPEKYLHSIDVTVLLLNVIGLFICGYLLLSLGCSLGVMLLVQGAFFVYPPTLLEVGRFRPESLLILCGSLLVSVIVYNLKSNQQKYFLQGLIIAFGSAVKIIFLPIALTVTMFNSIKKVSLSVLGVIVGCYVFTFPIRKQYERIYDWLLKLSRGPEQIESILPISEVFKIFFGYQSVLYTLILLLVALVIFFTKRPNNFTSIKLILSFIALIVIQIFLTSKRVNELYLIQPMVVVVPMLIYLLGTLVIENTYIKKSLYLFLAYFVIKLSSHSVIHAFHASQDWSYNAAQNFQFLERHSQSNCTWVGKYTSSHPVYALAYANAYSDELFSEHLRRLYPTGIQLDGGDGYRSFAKSISKKQLQEQLNEGKCFYLFSNGAKKLLSQPEYQNQFKYIESIGGEDLLLVTRFN